MSSVYNLAPREFLDARDAVAERIAAGSPEPSAPRVLPWAAIEVIPEVFQQRRIDAEVSGDHVQDMARAIKRGPRGAAQAHLEPITIFWVGDAWACVDGHHRMEAYRKVKHPAPIPVQVLRGATLGGAVQASLAGNIKGKLRMTKRCMSEAAWRFTLEGAMSKATIKALAGVDESTVAIMRRTLKEFRAAHPEVPPEDMTWAKMRHWKLPAAELDGKTPEQQKAEQLLRRTEKHLQGVSPTVLLLALGMHDPGLVERLFQVHRAQREHEAYRADPFAPLPSFDQENPDF